MPETINPLDFHPRKFKSLSDTTPGESYRDRNEASRATLERMSKRAEQLTPRDAVALAQRLLVHVEEFGIDYGDFQSAQAVERYVHKAVLALRGLSLS